MSRVYFPMLDQRERRQRRQRATIGLAFFVAVSIFNTAAKLVALVLARKITIWVYLDLSASVFILAMATNMLWRHLKSPGATHG
jgi:hypothetical protein